MGSRSDQYIGLNLRTMEYLNTNAKMDLIETYKNKELIDSHYSFKGFPGKYSYTGMFGYEYLLDGYELKDGTILYEFVQEEPWSSGPMYFTCLVDENENMIEELKWTDKEIEEYIS